MHLRIIGNIEDVTQDDRQRASHRVWGALYRVEPQVGGVVVQLGQPRDRESLDVAPQNQTPTKVAENAVYKVYVRWTDGRLNRLRGSAPRMSDAIDAMGKRLQHVAQKHLDTATEQQALPSREPGMADVAFSR